LVKYLRIGIFVHAFNTQILLVGIFAFHHGHSHGGGGHGHSHGGGHGHSHDDPMSVKVGNTYNDQINHFNNHSNNHGHSHSDGNSHGHSHGGHGHSHGGHGHSHQNSDALQQTGGRSQIMDGVFLHILADTLGSVGVIISAILMHLFGWMVADPICSMFIAILIALSVLGLIKDSVMILMQRQPKELDRQLPQCYQRVAQLEGVLSVQVCNPQLPGIFSV
jgi:solute carrier family 30 (zinc transporter), member 5/7